MEQLKEIYKNEVIPAMMKKFEYKSVMQVPKLEKIVFFEEQLQELKEKEEKLEKDNNAIELAKEILEISYKKMKQSITPKLTEELSKNIYENLYAITPRDSINDIKKEYERQEKEHEKELTHTHTRTYDRDR